MEAGLDGPTTKSLDERGIAVEGTHDGAAPRRLGDAAERVEQQVVPLVGDHGGDAQQPAPAAGTGRLVVQVHARTGDVHPLRREPVTVEQQLP